MNIGGRLEGWLWIWLMIAGSTANAQVIFNPKIGLDSWSLADEKDASDVSKHPGQTLGLGLILKKEKWLFMPGMEYHRISMKNEDHRYGFDFNESHHAHYLIFPLQAGYTFATTSNFVFSGVAGGDVNFFYDMDDNELGLMADQFYGVTTALTASLFVEMFSLFTAEVKYHYGLQSALKTREDAKWRGWTIAVGCTF